MTLETFFEKFDLFAEAPNAVGKIRELVMDLAVRGRLVPQDPNDHNIQEFPASERADLPELPKSWTWSDLGAVSTRMDSGWSPACDSEPAHISEWGVLKTTSVQKQEYREIENKRLPRNLVPRPDSEVATGDILLTRAGPMNRVGIVCVARPTRPKLMISDKIIRFHLTPDINPEYAALALNNGFSAEVIEGLKSGMAASQVNISQPKLKSVPLPLPPLAEQKRIVAKVDELMASCHRLEAQQQERETQHAVLARAALSRFAEAPTPANLDFLFHQSYVIPPADLRKSILTLAVQGKLVPQDPNDEPAEECLIRIGVKNTLPPDEVDDSLPSSWSRVRFEDVAVTAGGVTLGRKLGDRKTITLPYLRVANVKRGEIDLAIIKELSIAEDEIDRYALKENDLLMTEGGDWDKVGRAAIWEGRIPVCLHQNHVFRSRMRSSEISPVWFERYFNSPDGRRYFESASKQTTNLASINMRQVRGCPVPLPPLPEQRRIVAKVDELMELVDALETQLATARTTAASFLAAAVAELTQVS